MHSLIKIVLSRLLLVINLTATFCHTKIDGKIFEGPDPASQIDLIQDSNKPHVKNMYNCKIKLGQFLILYFTNYKVGIHYFTVISWELFLNEKSWSHYS